MIRHPYDRHLRRQKFADWMPDSLRGVANRRTSRGIIQIAIRNSTVTVTFRSNTFLISTVEAWWIWRPAYLHKWVILLDCLYHTSALTAKQPERYQNMVETFSMVLCARNVAKIRYHKVLVSQTIIIMLNIINKASSTTVIITLLASMLDLIQ